MMNIDKLKQKVCALDAEKQLQFWQRFAVFLSNSEIKSVMEAAREGVDLFLAHDRLRVFEKYYSDAMRLVDKI